MYPWPKAAAENRQAPLSGQHCVTPCRARDRRRYNRRNRPFCDIALRYTAGQRCEIMFGRLKDWRRVATRYDRNPVIFLSAIALAAIVIFWLKMGMSPEPNWIGREVAAILRKIGRKSRA